MSIQLTSTAFTEGSMIPKQYTCDGGDVSPPLSWSGIPNGTKSLALIADDPDAPIGTFTHWVLFNIPATLNGLPEGVVKTASVADIGTHGKNNFANAFYNGPCPPKGKAHRYFFRLYALDRKLDLKPGCSRQDLEKAMRGRILAQGQLMGIYGR